MLPLITHLDSLIYAVAIRRMPYAERLFSILVTRHALRVTMARSLAAAVCRQPYAVRPCLQPLFPIDFARRRDYNREWNSVK